jgi:hypothetical protein
MTIDQAGKTAQAPQALGTVAARWEALQQRRTRTAAELDPTMDLAAMDLETVREVAGRLDSVTTFDERTLWSLAETLAMMVRLTERAMDDLQRAERELRLAEVVAKIVTVLEEMSEGRDAADGVPLEDLRDALYYRGAYELVSGSWFDAGVAELVASPAYDATLVRDETVVAREGQPVDMSVRARAARRAAVLVGDVSYHRLVFRGRVGADVDGGTES